MSNFIVIFLTFFGGEGMYKLFEYFILFFTKPSKKNLLPLANSGMLGSSKILKKLPKTYLNIFSYGIDPCLQGKLCFI
jgi:hypothetical protein